jgi:hypothetical protein
MPTSSRMAVDMKFMATDFLVIQLMNVDDALGVVNLLLLQGYVIQKKGILEFLLEFLMIGGGIAYFRIVIFLFVDSSRADTP